MKDDSPGSIQGCDKCFRITSALSIEADVAAVWQTATLAEEIGWWFAPGTIEAEGGRIQLNFRDGSFGMRGDVKVLHAPHVFEFTWEAEAEDTRATLVRFRLRSDGSAADPSHDDQLRVWRSRHGTARHLYLALHAGTSGEGSY